MRILVGCRDKGGLLHLVVWCALTLLVLLPHQGSANISPLITSNQHSTRSTPIMRGTPSILRIPATQLWFTRFGSVCWPSEGGNVP